MTYIDASINTVNLAVAVSPRPHFDTITSVHPQVVAPVSVPNYLGGATIVLALFGMLAVSAQAAGFTSKSVKPKQAVVKGHSISPHRTSH